MATRFYLDPSADTVPISPTPDAAWNNTSFFRRVLCATSKSGEAFATRSFSETTGVNSASTNYLYQQYISHPLTAGQTITQNKLVKAQVLIAEEFIANNMFLTVGVRVIAANGTTVQKTVVAVTRNGSEAAVGTLTNRTWSVSMGANGNYTTVAGDRLVIEVGLGGQPTASGSYSHNSSIRFGSAAGVDMPVNNTTTADDDPWVELNFDTLTFDAEPTTTTVPPTTVPPTTTTTTPTTTIPSTTTAPATTTEPPTGTRLYLDAGADTVPISPTPDSAWEDTSLLTRVLCGTTKSGEAMSTVSFTDANDADRDILFRQYVSPKLSAGQTITGSATVKAQCRVSEDFIANNMDLTVGIRIVAADGVTVNKTVIAVTRQINEAVVGTLTNRAWSKTTASGNYTTMAGDRLVVEIGMGGGPVPGLGTHSSSMRLGSASGTDLTAGDNSSTADDSPWVEILDTLTFTFASDFSDSEADTGTLSDAETASVVSAQSDSVPLSDAESAAVGAARADSVSLSDIVAIVAENTAVLVDYAVLSDAESATVRAARADSFALSDAESAAVGAARADSVPLSDAAVAGVRPAAQSDSIPLSDAAVAGVRPAAQSDSIPLSDAESAAVGSAQSDSFALSDAAIVGTAKSDSVSLSDSKTAKAVKALSDAVALSDGVAVSVGKATGDAVALSDKEKAAWTVAGGPPTTTAAIIAQKEDDHQRVVLWDLFAGSADFAAANFHADIAQRLNLSLPIGDITVALTGGGYSIDYDAADDTLNVGCDESDPSSGGCHAELGSPTESEGGRLLVANLYYCARAALLTEMEQFLEMASPTNVEFFVYEAMDDAALAENLPRPRPAPEPGTSASYGVIDPASDDADERHRLARSDFQSAFGLVARSAAGFSAGTRFRSSGPIGVELRQGRFYLIGAAWTSGGVACFWGGGHPAGTPFGRSLGGLRLAHDGDLPATLSPTTDASLARPMIDDRAYHQRLTLDGRGVGRGASGATLFVIDADRNPDGMRVGRGGPGDLRVGTINATGAGIVRILTNVGVGQVIGGPAPQFFDGSIDPPGPEPDTRYAVKVNRAVYRTRQGSPARCRCHRRFYREPEEWREFRTEADARAYFDTLEPAARAAIGVTDGGLDVIGCRGGPFGPNSAEFRVANSGDFPVVWSASSDSPWVRLSGAGGSLPNPGDEAVVAASLEGAESLCTGVHAAAVTIANETNGVGTAVRAFRLEVRGRPSPEVEPAGDFRAEGPPGGPFTPPDAHWILRNADECPMRWRADWSAGWLTVSPAGGTIPGGGEVAVAASLGPQAESLPPDRYKDRVVFRNLTSGRELVGRGVSLFIRPTF